MPTNEQQTKRPAGPDWAKKYPPRALTRGQIKALRALGVNLAMLSPNQADEAVDLVMAYVYDADKLARIDDEPNSATLALFKRVIDLTYGPDEGEAKN